MDNIIIAQEMTVAAPQLEVDQAAKNQLASKQSQVINQVAFMKVLSDSMDEVHTTLQIEKEDPFQENEEKEEEDQEER